MKSLFTVIGFLLFVLGIVSIILSMVGMQFTFLLWLDNFGRLWGFLIRLVMILAGITMVYLSTTPWNDSEL